MKDNAIAEKENKNFVRKMAEFIVDKRKAFYLIYAGLIIFCIFSSGWTSVDNLLSDYLPESTETRTGLAVMDDEFVTFATAKVMVENISYESALEMADEIEKIDGVKSVEFVDEDDEDSDNDNYKDFSALYEVTFDGEDDDAVSETALDDVKALLSEYDLYVSSDIGDVEAKLLDSEMQIVMAIAAVIIVAVLLFTSHTYAEIPVLIMTFGTAAILNKGSNFFFGTISFVSNSVAVVLQLALAVDYAIILCHRYTEERTRSDAREAVITALSKAVPEISGSSLTTLSGLAAMTFMQFRIGYDMGIILIKAICISLVCVFTLMPGLLMSFSPLIDKTHHKSFVPKINIWGKFVIKSRFIGPPVFLVIVIAAFVFQNMCPYVYGTSTLSTITKNEMQIAEQKITDTFGSENTIAMLVPEGDYEKEAKLLKALEAMPEVDSAMGLANINAKDDYTLTELLNPRKFAELTDMDVETSRVLYTIYAAEKENYGNIIGGIDNYEIPLIDIFTFLYEKANEGYVDLDDETMDDLTEMNDEINDAKLQLQGKDYSRFVLDLTLPEESTETFAFLTTLHETAKKYYDDGCLLVGDSTSDYDLSSSFQRDNVLISILTIVFVILVLIFTFKSAGIPVLLIMVIQGSVWINFAFPYILQQNLFFMSYLVVSSIQMGANIDYAIVMTNRYTALRTQMPLKKAIVETLNQAFPTIVTSGTMLASAGILIGLLSSSEVVASIGVCLGRGTLLSIFLVMFVLPQLLLMGDFIIEKTAFTLKKRELPKMHSGAMKVNGHLRGYVSGIVDGEFSGVVKGTVNAVIDNSDIEKIEDDDSEICQKEVNSDEKDSDGKSE